MSDQAYIIEDDPDLVPITVEGLWKRSNIVSQHTEQHVEQFHLPKNAPLAALSARIICAMPLFFSLNRFRSAGLMNFS
jgi:hypothetical protein